MKIIVYRLLGVSFLALFLTTGNSYAATILQSIGSAVQPSGKSTLRFQFDSKVETPKVFILKQPASIVLDFPGAVRGISRRSQKLNSKFVKGVRIADAADKLRVLVSLYKHTKHTTSLQGNEVVLTFEEDKGFKNTRNAVTKAVVQDSSPSVSQRQALVKARQVAAQKKAMEKRRIALQRNKARKRAENQQLVVGANNAVVQGNPSISQNKALAKARQVAAQKKAMEKRRIALQRNKARKRAENQQLVVGANNALDSVAQAKSIKQKTAPVQQLAIQRPTPRKVAHANVLGNIDFHRRNNGGGRAVIKLPQSSTVVETNKVGNSVVLTLKNVKTDQSKKRIDVLDFATPASYIDIARIGRDVQIKLSANEAFEYQTKRNGRDFIIDLKKAKLKKTINPLVRKNKKYTGKKLSLNFQDIEVRSVLQLLADFTDRNIVVSDSVTGNITLRLKDVPWDQALDIVLESKGLAMRANGNVIWVAKATELEAKEQSDLQAYKRKQALEPLITEYISVNYAKAGDMLALIQLDSGGDGSAISSRGHASVDERTNTFIIRETPSRVAEIRNLIESLDVPVKQVSVESRIVIATDEFSKELGARFGINAFSSNAATSGGLTSTNSMITDLAGGGNVGLPGLADRLNVNLPAAAGQQAGRFAFSLLSGDFLLDLELSALQAENKGEIISTPRVVTADKQKALIEQGVEIGFLEASSSGAATVSFKKAVLSLEVTPQITPDNHIIMDLKVNQDTPGALFAGVPSINTREVNTQVLVDNGQTVVLGGVHEEQNQSDVNKIPVLGDVPILGRLFRTDTDRDTKRELLIFVTPKIME